VSNTISRPLPGLQAAQLRVNKGKAPEAEPRARGKVVSGEGANAPHPNATGDPSAAVSASSNLPSSTRLATAYNNGAQDPAAMADDRSKAFAEAIADELEEVALANDRTGIRVQTEIHEETGRYIVRVIESETGEVLREFPPMEYLDVVAALDELEGLFLEEEL